MVRALTAEELTEEAPALNLDAPVKKLPTILRGIEDVDALEAALQA